MTSHHQFKVGDRVRRRTGGPDMTIVSRVVESDRPVVYVCEWIADETQRRVSLTGDVLEPVTRPGTSVP
jgi:uncharacterized protein YodC (DUF2158 family)